TSFTSALGSLARLNPNTTLFGTDFLEGAASGLDLKRFIASGMGLGLLFSSVLGGSMFEATLCVGLSALRFSAL
ncbi:MAG: hypothetical protein ACW7DX_12410, partial [Paraglaciecola chathamensis]